MHVSRKPSRDDHLDCWRYEVGGETMPRWQYQSCRRVSPGDVNTRFKQDFHNGYRLYADVLQSHQLRVVIAYHMRFVPLDSGAYARDHGEPPREFSVHPHGPHMPTAFRREQWRHRYEEEWLDRQAAYPVPEEGPRPDPGQCNDVSCRFLAQHWGGWPDITELPSTLIDSAAWHPHVSASNLSVLADLYVVGLRLVQQHGQALYEHYGRTCWPGNNTEVWAYGPISGMRVHASMQDPAAVSAAYPNIVPIGAWARAQLLVISIATRRYGCGPRQNGLPPPLGTAALTRSWARPSADEPAFELAADYASLRVAEWGF